jgi:hypothetical protein
VAHLADGALLHEARGLVDGGDVAVGEVDHVHDACERRRIGHLARMGVVGGERLLAQDVLAGREERERRGVVHGVGRDVGHRVELASQARASCTDGEAARDAVVSLKAWRRSVVGVVPAQVTPGWRRSLGWGGPCAGADDRRAARARRTRRGRGARLGRRLGGAVVAGPRSAPVWWSVSTEPSSPAGGAGRRAPRWARAPCRRERWAPGHRRPAPAGTGLWAHLTALRRTVWTLASW